MKTDLINFVIGALSQHDLYEDLDQCSTPYAIQILEFVQCILNDVQLDLQFSFPEQKIFHEMLQPVIEQQPVLKRWIRIINDETVIQEDD